MRTGFQGAHGAFGEEAAAAWGGDPVPFASFDELLGALGRGEIDEAVLPIDNLVVGPIVEALVPLAGAIARGLSLVTLGLKAVPVRLALAARPGATLATLRKVRSHPAALRQCGLALAELGLTAESTWDTAGAAREVAQGDLTQGAICSRGAAESAGLVVLREDCSDRQPNETRFVRLRGGAAGPPGEASLAELRAGIDALDIEIASSVGRRLQLAQRIGEVKKRLGIEVRDTTREEEVRRRYHALLARHPQVADALVDLLFAAAWSEQGL